VIAQSSVAISKASRLVLHGTANGTKVNQLLDAGANVDSIDERFVKKLGLEDRVVPLKQKVTGTSFTGEAMPISGMIFLEIVNGNGTYTNSFYVFPKLHGFDIILGMPFFNFCGVTDSIQNRICELYGDDVVRHEHTVTADENTEAPKN